jgi:hypothetical protein
MHAERSNEPVFDRSEIGWRCDLVERQGPRADGWSGFESKDRSANPVPSGKLVRTIDPKKSRENRDDCS